jgi:hypothetical protein
MENFGWKNNMLKVYGFIFIKNLGSVLLHTTNDNEMKKKKWIDFVEIKFHLNDIATPTWIQFNSKIIIELKFELIELNSCLIEEKHQCPRYWKYVHHFHH